MMGQRHVAWHSHVAPADQLRLRHYAVWDVTEPRSS
jgi:hypothetical protein